MGNKVSSTGGAGKKTVDLSTATEATPATSVQVAGWCATNGGVKAYYYRVNGGEWIAVDPEKSAAPISSTTAGGYTTMTDSYTGHDKGILFNGGEKGISTHDLTEYAGQTVTIEFGACPNNNPGTDGQPNVFAFVELTNVKVAE